MGNAVHWARGIQDLPIAAKSVLNALASYADGDGICWPAVETLARDTCMNGRHVRRMVRALEAAGLVVVEVSKRSSGGQTSNVYRLACPWVISAPKRKPELSPAQKRAAYLRINAVSSPPKNLETPSANQADQESIDLAKRLIVIAERLLSLGGGVGA